MVYTFATGLNLIARPSDRHRIVGNLQVEKHGESHEIGLADSAMALSSSQKDELLHLDNDGHSPKMLTRKREKEGRHTTIRQEIASRP